MSDLQALHTQAKKLILTIRAGLERLETAEQVRRHSARWGGQLPPYLCRLPAARPRLPHCSSKLSRLAAKPVPPA